MAGLKPRRRRRCISRRCCPPAAAPRGQARIRRIGTLPLGAVLATVLGVLVALPARTASGAATNLYDDRGGRLEIHLEEGLSAVEQVEMQRWIEGIAASLADIYGHWPRRHWRVFVQGTSGASSDPIPWAQVNRGEVDEVHFYVIASTPGEQLLQEWTGYHELAHLLIPYRGWGDTWFSEGLASYYQNLLQARSGIISEQQLWQKLYEGFQRGRNDRQFDGQSLRSVSARLRSSGGFMRVYWSGAWYFLAADLHLRASGGNHASLDRALQKLNRCCADRAMSVPEMVRRLDSLEGGRLFQQLYDSVVVSTAVPDFESLFASLGLRVHHDQVILEGTPQQAALRSGFLRPLAFNR